MKKFNQLFIILTCLFLLLSACRHGLILVPPADNPYYSKKSDRSAAPNNENPDNNVQQASQTVPQYQQYSNNNSTINSQTGDRWAVIIGVSNYKYSDPKSGLSNLIFADDDASDFYNALKKIGWQDSHIKMLLNENATVMNIRIALESWLTKAGPNDQILLYWSGHGYPDPENPEKVYFACHDTNILIPATGYRMDAVRDTLEELNTKNVLLLADTCHAGKLITRGNPQMGSITPYIDKMSKEQNVPRGWIFMVSADADRQAIEDSSWSNGAFTHCLLEAMAGKADGFKSSGKKDGYITLGEIRTYLTMKMPEETQKAFGVAKHPLITTSTGDPGIWDLRLDYPK
jgi:hypothetical protein